MKIRLLSIASLATLAAFSHAGFVTYTGVPGPYTAFAAATGVIGFDDYTTTMASPTFVLDSMKFVGGVTTAGMTLQFEFYDQGANLVNFFSAALPQGGNFVWTITDINMTVANKGFLQIRALSGSTGRWFFTTTGPTVGSNSVAVGTGSTVSPQRNQAFELSAVPEPGTFVAMGLGAAGLMLRRRARKA